MKYWTGQERQQEETGEQVHAVRLFGDDAELLEEPTESLEASSPSSLVSSDSGAPKAPRSRRGNHRSGCAGATGIG